MEDLSLHILDIAENSINAGASKIIIRITEDIESNLFLLEITDNGQGMNEEVLRQARDPFFTTKTTRRVGLGIPLLAQAARESNGDITIKTERGKGSSITASFQYDHIDRKPLGSIEKTMIVMISAHPDIDFFLEYKKNSDSYILDTEDIKQKLDGIPVNDPSVIRIIKEDISAWLNKDDNMIK